jgi:hypothetical protein
MIAVITFNPGETLMELSTIQVLIDNIHHMGTPITIFMLITLIPNPFQFLKLCLYTPVILTFSRISRNIGFSYGRTCKHSLPPE